MFPNQSKKPLPNNEARKIGQSQHNLQNSKNGAAKKVNDVIGNHEDFLKIYNEYKNQEMQKMKIQEEKYKAKTDEKKKKFMQKKKDEEKVNALEVSLLSEESKKSDRLHKAISQQISHFAKTNTPRMAETELDKIRFKSKQKIFNSLIFGIQELKEAKNFQINKTDFCEQRISKFKQKEAFIHSKTLTIEIDLHFLYILKNAKDKQAAYKKYKSLIKVLSQNLGQESNNQLRKKILTRSLTPTDLAIMNEEELFTPEARQKIIQNQNLFLREATVPEKYLISSNEDPLTQEIEAIQTKSEAPKKQYEYKYVNASTVNKLAFLLNDEQIDKMKSDLVFEKQSMIQQKLQTHINMLRNQPI